MTFLCSFLFLAIFFLDIPGHGLGEYPGSLDDKVIVLYRVRKYFFSKMVITIGLGTSYVTWHAFSREISTQKTLTFTKKDNIKGHNKIPSMTLYFSKYTSTKRKYIIIYKFMEC